MRKCSLLFLFAFLTSRLVCQAQTMGLAVGHIENLDKTAEAATKAFVEYADARLLNKKEKDVTRKRIRLTEVVQAQEKRIANEKPFNGQTRLKSAYSNFVNKLKQFPDNLAPYAELSVADFRTGLAQNRKKEFMTQLDVLKQASADLNLEVSKYITLNKCKDFTKGSVIGDKWQKAFTIYVYGQKLQEAVFTVGALDRYFYELMAVDSLDKAEIVRLAMLQQSATLGGTVKIKPPVPTDFSLREAAVNSINLYRMDAFRNFKSMIALRKKEMAFRKKNSGTGAAKTEAAQAKLEKEKSQLESEISDVRNLVREMKKERDHHESAFDGYLAQYLDRWALGD